MSGGLTLLLSSRRHRAEVLVAIACVAALCGAALHRAVSLLDTVASNTPPNTHVHFPSRANAMAGLPLPISFGPASAPLALAVRRHLKHLLADKGEFEAVWAGGGGGGAVRVDFKAASAKFDAAINGYTVGHAEVADLVAAWLREITTREAANDVIQDALKHGVPAIGMRCGSRVVCARAAKKWVKAGKALRSLFTTVHEYADVMEAVVFEAIPRVMALQGGGISPSKACDVVKKKGVVGSPNGPVVVLIRRTGEVLVVSSDEKDVAMATNDAVDLRDVLELPRYAAMYICRETSPPTIIPGYTSALTGWVYNATEEDVLTALHAPSFEKELRALTAELDAAAGEGGRRNEMLEVQIEIMKQYLDHHRDSYARFKERKWGTVSVGGAGRASAEVARDLSRFYRGVVATRAVDHRRRVSDVFETEDGPAIKSAYTNFIKELTKEAEHLPTFADTEIAAHYVAVRDELLRRGSDPWTIDNINRILHANAVMLGDRAPALPEGTEATAAPNFSLGFGARGSGDVVFADPHCHKGDHPYIPGTMDAKLMETLIAFL